MKTKRRHYRKSGFTLIEVLTASTIFVVMAGILLSLSGQATSLWSWNHRQSQLREKARTALDFIGSEMQQAVLPLDRTSQSGPQFLVNPQGIAATLLERDAVFWQAPIATNRSHGSLAIVGYFVRHDAGRYQLCRYFINPDEEHYRLQSHPDDRVNDALLDAVAPATETDNKGLFLENVVGLWVQCFDESGALIPAANSRVDGRLPARVKVSLAILDDIGAARVKEGAALPSTSLSDNAEAYLTQASKTLLPTMTTVQIDITFENRSL